MVVGVVTSAVDPTGTGDNKRDPAIGYARLAAYARELIEKAK
jgi:hypothetical protein